MLAEQHFSARLRPLLERCGAEVTQVIEAGCPGPADLLLEWTGLYAWLELKVRVNQERYAAGGSPSAQQVAFLKKRWALNGNAFLLQELRSKPFADHEQGTPVGWFLWKGKDVALKLDHKKACWRSRSLDVHVVSDMLDVVTRHSKPIGMTLIRRVGLLGP